MDDFIYEWTDFGFALIFGVVCPTVFLYVAVTVFRETRHRLEENDLWGIGALLFLAIGMPVMALLIYFDAMSESMIFLLAFCSAIQIALFAVMLKLFRNALAAKRWASTTGTVIISRVESRKKVPGEFGYDFADTEVANLPLVEYEYTITEQTFRGRRITIGEGTSTYDLESILDRYPVGAKVDVYYDPADPNQAVLERELPPGTYWICSILTLLPFGVPFGGMLAYNAVTTGSRPSLGGELCLGAMALATLGLAFAYTLMCWQASRWPTTRGRVVAADIDAHRSAFRRRRTYYKPSVLYVYEVNGREYHGDRLRIGVVVSTTIPGLAAHTASKYPVGSEVIVHYNPANPSQSVLHPWSAWIAVPWLIILGLVVLGWTIR